MIELCFLRYPIEHFILPFHSYVFIIMYCMPVCQPNFHFLWTNIIYLILSYLILLRMLCSSIWPWRPFWIWPPSGRLLRISNCHPRFSWRYMPKEHKSTFKFRRALIVHGGIARSWTIIDLPWCISSMMRYLDERIGICVRPPLSLHPAITDDNLWFHWRRPRDRCD